MTSNYSYETNPRIFTLFLFYLRSRRESFSQLEETLRTLFLFFFFQPRHRLNLIQNSSGAILNLPSIKICTNYTIGKITKRSICKKDSKLWIHSARHLIILN